MPDWQDALENDELKTDATLRNFDTPEAAFQGLIDLKRREGGMIRLSSEDASDADRQANREKIMKAHPDLMLKPDWTDETATADYLAYAGVPEAADKYDVGDSKIPAEMLETLKANALVEELTPRQFKARMANMESMFTDQAESADTDYANEQKAILDKWGASHDARMTQVEWVTKEFFSEFGDLGPLNNIAIQGLYKIAQSLQGKGPQAHGQPLVPESAISPDEAAARVNELRNKIIENKDPSQKAKLTQQMIEAQKLTNPAAYQ